MFPSEAPDLWLPPQESLPLDVWEIPYGDHRFGDIFSSAPVHPALQAIIDWEEPFSENEVCPPLAENKFIVVTDFQRKQTSHWFWGEQIDGYNYDHYYLKPWTAESLPKHCVYAVVSRVQSKNGRFAIVTMVGLENSLPNLGADTSVIHLAKKPNNILQPTGLAYSELLSQAQRPMELHGRNLTLLAEPNQIFLPLVNGSDNLVDLPDSTGLQGVSLDQLIASIQLNARADMSKSKAKKVQFIPIDLGDEQPINPEFASGIQTVLPSFTPTVTATPEIPPTTTPLPPYSVDSPADSPDQMPALERYPIENPSALYINLDIGRDDELPIISSSSLASTLAPNGLLADNLTPAQIMIEVQKVIDSMPERGIFSFLASKPTSPLGNYEVLTNTKLRLQVIATLPLAADNTRVIAIDSATNLAYVIDLDETSWWSHLVSKIFDKKVTHDASTFTTFTTVNHDGTNSSSTTITADSIYRWDTLAFSSPHNHTFVVSPELVKSLQVHVNKKTSENQMNRLLESAHRDYPLLTDCFIIDSAGVKQPISIPTTIALTNQGIMSGPDNTLSLHGELSLSFGMQGMPQYISPELLKQFAATIMSYYGGVLPPSVKLIIPLNAGFTLDYNSSEKPIHIFNTPIPTVTPTPTRSSYNMPDPRPKDEALQAFNHIPAFKQMKNRHRLLKIHNRNVQHGRV